MTIARVVNGTPTYVHNDHLGTAVSATDQAGNILWRESYFPFGEKRENPAAARDDQGYTGHVQDETGLTYMQARYYDPVIGRFLSNDPVGFSVEHPQVFNRYSYTFNDPVNHMDPDGEFGTIAFGAIVGGTIGAFVGGASEAYSQHKKGEGFNFGSIAAKAATSGVSGAITGAVAGSGAGLIAVATTGAAYGGAVDTAIDSATSG